MQKKLIYILVLFISTVSCKKDYLVEEPKDVLTPENLYVNKAGFERGLYGLYNLIRQERGGYNQSGTNAQPNNNIVNGIMMVGVDNAYSNFPADNNERYYNEWASMGRTLITDAYNSSIFGWLYQIINGANTIIGRAENKNISWTESEKNQIVAEAKVIRAWAYRHLTFLWGDVPLKLDESDKVITDFTRTPKEQVRLQMEQDLLWAEANLAEDAIAEGRICKAVATHYLAELYLTIQDYQKAKDKASSIVNNSKYALVTARYGVNKNSPGTPFTDMFLDGNSNRSNGNTEAIWVFQNNYLLQNTGGDANIMRRYWVNRYDAILINNSNPISVTASNGGRGLGRFAATRYALQVYSSSIGGRVGSALTDHRGGATGGQYAWRFFWIANKAGGGINVGDRITNNYNQDETLNNPRWPNTRKWDWAPNVASDVTNPSGYNNQIYIRAAEDYLFLAEAQYFLGDLAGAATTINALRTRANTTPVSASDISIDFILDERSRELFSEEHRRYTLLRVRDPQNPNQPIWFNRTSTYNKIAGSNIMLRDTLLPIPLSVIQSNSTKPFPQNPGYN